MNKEIAIEVCVDSVESAMIAQEAGAQRIELCDNLVEGGTTPSAAMIEIAREKLEIDLNVIIRPRGGDFLYSYLEIEVMRRDIEIAKRAGADGVVIGTLTADGEIDASLCQSLIEIARPMSVTFHRAFDVCKNPLLSLEMLIELGFDRLLTSGQENKAKKGIKLISDLIKKADGRIIIMPGSGINESNFLDLMNQSHATEFHLSARSQIKSAMRFKRLQVKMGGISNYDEYSIKRSDLQKLKAIVELTKS
jgi:copper homeostasis protein